MTCAQHHALVVGNLLRTCQIGGTWDGVEPLCEGFILKKQLHYLEIDLSQSCLKKMLANEQIVHDVCNNV